jgi:hypothetical protein
MKNRNLQFKATALLIPLLACLAVFFAGITPARAGDLVTFNGTVSGYVQSAEPPVGCLQTLHVVNFGNANQLGAFTGTAEFIVNNCDGTYTGFFHWSAANGDKLEGTFDGYLTPSATPGVYDNHENADITSGTGRFAGATGHFELGGQVDFTTNPPSFVLPWQGTISSVGSSKK